MLLMRMTLRLVIILMLTTTTLPGMMATTVRVMLLFVLQCELQRGEEDEEQHDTKVQPPSPQRHRACSGLTTVCWLGWFAVRPLACEHRVLACELAATSALLLLGTDPEVLL